MSKVGRHPEGDVGHPRRKWLAIGVGTAMAVLIGVSAIGARGLPDRAAARTAAPIDITGRQVGEVVFWTAVVAAVVVLAIALWPGGGRPALPRRRGSLARFLLLLAAITLFMVIVRVALPETVGDGLDVAPQAIQNPDREARPLWAVVLLGGGVAAAALAIGLISRRGGGTVTTVDTTRSDEQPAPGETSDPIRLALIGARGAHDRAVVRHYAAMVEVLTEAGVPRDASEASGEYAYRVAGRLTDPTPAHRLTALFQRAAFSDHDATLEMVAEADSALGDVTAQVEQHP